MATLPTQDWLEPSRGLEHFKNKIRTSGAGLAKRTVGKNYGESGDNQGLAALQRGL